MSINESYFEGVRQRISENSLHISNIPRELKSRFIELAKLEYARPVGVDGESTPDYGVFLKKLLDVYDGLYPPVNAQIDLILDRLDQAEARIMKLESTEEKPAKEIRLLSGRVIRRGGKDEQVKQPTGQESKV